MCIFGGVEIEPRQGANDDDGQGGGRPAGAPSRRFETPKKQISKRVLLRSTVWGDARLEPEGWRKRLAANHPIPELVGPEGQSASAAEAMWSRAKGELRTSNVRRPVGDDHAPPLAELIWRRRNARGPRGSRGRSAKSRNCSPPTSARLPSKSIGWPVDSIAPARRHSAPMRRTEEITVRRKRQKKAFTAG